MRWCTPGILDPEWLQKERASPRQVWTICGDPVWGGRGSAGWQIVGLLYTRPWVLGLGWRAFIGVNMVTWVSWFFFCWLGENTLTRSSLEKKGFFGLNFQVTVHRWGSQGRNSRRKWSRISGGVLLNGSLPGLHSASFAICSGPTGLHMLLSQWAGSSDNRDSAPQAWTQTNLTKANSGKFPLPRWLLVV